MDWDHYFMRIAQTVSLKSKDRSVKFGAVIVGPDHEIRTTGYNGFPRGIDDTVEDYHQRPEKYFWTEHAERNAIYNAARCGVPLKDCTLYVTGPPCNDCTRAIIQSGIKEVIYTDPPETDSGSMMKQVGHFTRSLEMMKQAGVKVMFIPNF